MKNGVLYGSFNPLHAAHVSLIEEGLRHFNILHVFVRNVPSEDIVGYDTKKEWLDKLNDSLDNRLRIYPLTFPEGAVNQNGSFDLVKIFLHTQDCAGVQIDGMICGSDKEKWVDVLKPEFPDREFYVIQRDELRSHNIRGDIEGLRESVPDYVYETLKNL